MRSVAVVLLSATPLTRTGDGVGDIDGVAVTTGPGVGDDETLGVGDIDGVAVTAEPGVGDDETLGVGVGVILIGTVSSQ